MNESVERYDTKFKGDLEEIVSKEAKANASEISHAKIILYFMRACFRKIIFI